jgi:choline-sulfatase
VGAVRVVRRAALPALPKQYAAAERPDHPYLREYAHCVDYDAHFKSAADVKRAIAGYYGLVSSVDENIGKVLRALERSGLAADTRVVYTSDHGDNVGARGLWGKSTLYEESAGVPLIVAGEGVPAAVRDAPTSHVDVYPFVFECVGAPVPDDDGHPGISLARLAAGERPDRGVLSEYHAIGSVAGAFMLRDGNYKYVYYVAYRPQLFDLARDPGELVDLAGDPAYAPVLERLRKRLFALCNPDEVDARAKRRQAELLARFGGREAALARGDLGFTPAPGTAPEMN